MRVRFTSLLLFGILLFSIITSNAAARTFAAPTPSPASVVAASFTIANSILRGGSTSQLAEVYAPTATLVVSTPAGQTSVFHKLKAIEGWYKAFAAGHVGIQLKQVSMRTPLPGMVIHYEIAVDASNAIKGRCAHVFAVTNGMIVSDDFIVFNGG
jgi:hypothetical protein